MEDKKITEQESLLLIQQMINTAKQEQKDDGLSWIIWGWLLFATSIFSYLNIQFRWLDQYFFWNTFGIISLVLLLYAIIREFLFSRKEKVKTYTGDLFKKLNVGFFITLMLIIISINMGVSPVKGFALLTGLYGFWILVYGAALDFKPSIVGAYLTWGFAFAGLFVEDDRFDIAMLLHGSAVLVGYIIPGHMAYKEFKKTILIEKSEE